MEGRKTIFNYLGEAINIFAITILILIGVAYITGDEVKDLSTMFQLGSRAIALSTMLQFFLMSVVITIIKFLLFSDHFFKESSILLKSIIMIVCVVVMTVIFANIFDWFPTNMWQPWVAFAISFSICFCSGIAVVALKNNLENKKMQEGLEKLKQEMSKGEPNE